MNPFPEFSLRTAASASEQSLLRRGERGSEGPAAQPILLGTPPTTLSFACSVPAAMCKFTLPHLHSCSLCLERPSLWPARTGDFCSRFLRSGAFSHKSVLEYFCPKSHVLGLHFLLLWARSPEDNFGQSIAVRIREDMSFRMCTSLVQIPVLMLTGWTALAKELNPPKRRCFI